MPDTQVAVDELTLVAAPWSPSIFYPAGTRVLSGNSRAALLQSTTGPTDSPLINLQRVTSHSGGTPGYVVTPLRVQTTVGAGVTDYEWSLTAICENYATAGNNLAGYFQGHKHSTGETWAAVSECTDYNNASSSVAGPMVSHEFDVTTSGLDDSGNGIRVGTDIVITQTGGTSSPAEVGYGSRVNVGSGNSVRRGYSVLGTFNQAAFDASLGTAGSRSSVTASAFRSAAGQQWDFSGTGAYVLVLNPAGNVLQYLANGATVVSLDGSGNLSVAGALNGLYVRTNGGSGPTWTAGTGAPSSTQPNGSLFSRTDGSTGSRLYVSAGGGTWNAVAGV
jgi:hypothetical protein